MFHQSLSEAFDDGTEVALHDGNHYRRVTLIYRRDPAGDIVPFCTLAEWAQTPIMQLAAKDAEIAALQAEIARLKKAPVLALPANTCPICKKNGLDPRGLAGHMWKTHQTRKSEYMPAAHV